MTKICWKGKAFKALTFGKKPQKAGRNFSGSITIFHRGGGAKKLLRRIDFQRKNPAQGFVERLEYDPNRTARVALVRWHSLNFCKQTDLLNCKQSFISQVNVNCRSYTRTNVHFSSFPNSEHLKLNLLHSKIVGLHKKYSEKYSQKKTFHFLERTPVSKLSWDIAEKKNNKNAVSQTTSEPHVQKSQNSTQKKAFSYILASEKLNPGDTLINIQGPVSPLLQSKHATERGTGWTTGTSETTGASVFLQTLQARQRRENSQQFEKIGNSIPLWLIPLGSIVHNIEISPGKGGTLARAAGTQAQLVQKPTTSFQIVNKPVHQEKSSFSSPSLQAILCTIRLPSGQQQLVDSRCRATIGVVSNSEHIARKLKKAGQTRWLGFRPVVRGVAMNPVDHPHGGGEGRTKGGRPSVSPWGKSAKAARANSTSKRRKLH